MGEVSSALLIGKKILARDGRELGQVDSLIVDTETWQVTALGTKVARDKLEQLNLKRKLVGSQSIVVPTSEVAAATDAVILKGLLSELSFSGGVQGKDDDGKDDDGKQDAVPDQ